MIPESFEYHAPKNLAEAMRLAGQFGSDGKLLAGGHSLIPLMKLRLAAPKHLIDITGIAELSYIREEDGRIQIGALATHFQLESSELLKSRCPLVPETAREIGDVQVRNKGTIGGSLAHSDPAADWPAAMVALEAEMLAVSVRGERWIPGKGFFVDLLATALQPDEILTAIRVPVLPARGGEAYLKLHHPASGFAVVGVAARVVLDEKGSIARIGVGVTGIGPKAYRPAALEEMLRGKSPSAKRLAEACAHAADGVEANADLYASAEYRQHLAEVYACRAIEKALERVGAIPQAS
jgi:aerobic carbon-monoxide dehydrogenase medium subunit